MDTLESLKNLETSFQKVRVNALITVLAAAAIVIVALFLAFDHAESAATRAYAIKDGVAVQLVATSMADHRKAEAEHHVRFYHDLMFNIAPDPRSIDYNKNRAEYLGDNSILLPFEQNKEDHFYDQLISGNMHQEFREDSIKVDMDTRPYKAIMYGRVYLTRSSSRVVKSLITSCELVDLIKNRSTNNSGGFLMQNFTILENKKLAYEAR